MKKHINKKSIIQVILSASALVLCMVCPWIRADASEPKSGAASAGSIVFENGMGSVAIYTEDISLLKEDLCPVRAETYDPAFYGPARLQEYTNITGSTYTERYSQRRTPIELAHRHTEASREKCVIAYDGKDYPGYRYLCACGFDWLQERYHTPVYTPIDASSHAVSCALHGTAYCDGTGEIEGEHINTLHPTDESHHRAVCDYCKYEGEEQACTFNIESSSDESGAAQVYCECGNYQIKPAAEDTTVQPEEKAEAEVPPSDPQEEISEKDEETEAGPSDPQEEASEKGEEIGAKPSGPQEETTGAKNEGGNE